MENFYLVHEDGKCKLKREDAERASKVIESNKQDAIKLAKEFILYQDGGFQEERTYPKFNASSNSKG